MRTNDKKDKSRSHLSDHLNRVVTNKSTRPSNFLLCPFPAQFSSLSITALHPFPHMTPPSCNYTAVYDRAPPLISNPFVLPNECDVLYAVFVEHTDISSYLSQSFFSTRMSNFFCIHLRHIQLITIVRRLLGNSGRFLNRDLL